MIVYPIPTFVQNCLLRGIIVLIWSVIIFKQHYFISSRSRFIIVVYCYGIRIYVVRCWIVHTAIIFKPFGDSNCQLSLYVSGYITLTSLWFVLIFFQTHRSKDFRMHSFENDFKSEYFIFVSRVIFEFP